MAKMSKEESDAWESLIKQISKASSPGQIEEVLATFTTVYQRKQIAKRVAALELLKKGRSYNQISDGLGLSPTIINALKKSMKSGQGYISDYEWVKKEGRKKKWSPYPKRSRRGLDPKKYILPHGKLAHPIRRDRYGL